MKISQNGINLIKGFEGLFLDAYQCEAGVWTIGYGHTKDVQPGQRINEKQAEEYLKEDLRRFVNAVNNKNNVPQKLNQNQFDALVSFAFNLGEGNLRELCTANFQNKTTAQIADEITLYCKVKIDNKYEDSKILINRRNKEKALFLTPVDPKNI